MAWNHNAARVAVLAAFRVELEKMADALADVSPREEAGPLRYVVGRRGDRPLLAGTTGMGKVRAAAAVQAVVDRFQPDLILFCGTAGGLSPRVKALDLVVADRFLCHDTGPEEPAWNEVEPELAARLAQGARSAAQNPAHTVHEGALITGDCPVLSVKEREILFNRFQALAVDMEAGAAAAVAALNRIPLAAVKAVTDSADKNGIRDFKKNVQAGAALAQSAVIHFLDM